MTTPDASAGLCDGCDTVTAVTASDDGRAQFCRACLPIANGETAPGIPPGRWRQGSHAPRNLWVGGAYPEGVDVGRMDTPELAAYVVEAVNGLAAARTEAGRLRAALAVLVDGVSPDQLCAREDCETERPAIERAWLLARDVLLDKRTIDLAAEAERLRAALQRIADLDDEQRIVAPDIASGALAGGS